MVIHENTSTVEDTLKTALGTAFGAYEDGSFLAMPRDTTRTPCLAYHFTGCLLRDWRRVPPPGEWLEYEGDLVLCAAGLHASRHPYDALQYAFGPYLHRVELGGLILEPEPPVDKLVAQRRRILTTIDATTLLGAFARWCALQALALWPAPAVVRTYLETGDTAFQREAYDAAVMGHRTCREYAAWAAAEGAAWAANDLPAWQIAHASARAVAWAAAQAAPGAPVETMTASALRDTFQQRVETAFSRNE